MQELSLQEMGIVPLVNSFILIAYTNKLKGFTPLRTGFLKTLKDSWFEG
jgi:peptide/nickel transport system substrate-binding protein